MILGLRTVLKDLGYRVYVDWVDDPELDRSNVDEETAKRLKLRMSAASSLFYVTTDNAKLSKWMPWECGYFDALKEKVAIFPIAKEQATTYQGQEYLGLYPYCLKGKSLFGEDVLRNQKPNKGYTVFDNWVNTPNNKVKWKYEK